VISASQAIEYVLKDDSLDPFDALEFLDMWQHGEWDVIRVEYPKAFEMLPEIKRIGV
jgi:hypothetical protein